MKKCQQPKEYATFEKEFLLDIEATIAAMEDVCPVAENKSLKSCPVFTTHNIAHINYANINSLTSLTDFINIEDVPSNAFKSNDEFESDFRMDMRDFYIEKAINLKQWIFLAKKLLENTRAKSVFYFFSPFLVHFCSGHQLKWFHIFYEECIHVKTVIRTWPANKMRFMKCPSVEEYL